VADENQDSDKENIEISNVTSEYELAVLLVREWINTLLNENLPMDSELFENSLKDGTVLCRTANVLKKGCIKRMHTITHMPVLASENIVSFLTACKEDLGIRQNDLFEPDDLLNAENMQKVMRMLTELMSRHHHPTIDDKAEEKLSSVILVHF